MDNKKEKSLAKGMLAHVDYETQRCQSMKEHANNVAEYVKNSCQIPELKPREFDTLKSQKVLQSLETGLLFCQIFIFNI